MANIALVRRLLPPLLGVGLGGLFEPAVVVGPEGLIVVEPEGGLVVATGVVVLARVMGTAVVSMVADVVPFRLLVEAIVVLPPPTVMVGMPGVPEHPCVKPSTRVCAALAREGSAVWLTAQFMQLWRFAALPAVQIQVVMSAVPVWQASMALAKGRQVASQGPKSSCLRETWGPGAMARAPVRTARQKTVERIGNC